MPPPQLYIAVLETACLGALLGLALYVMLEASGVFNFAVGGFAVAAPVLMVELSDAGVPLFAAALLALVATVVVCTASDAVIGRHIGDGTHDELPTVMAFVALLFALSQGIGWAFGRQVRSVPPLREGAPVRLGSVFLTQGFLVMAVVVVATFVVLSAWMRFGTTGRLVRAVGDNPQAAHVIGVPRRRIRVIGFSIGAALAGAAGILYAPKAGVSFDLALHWSLVGFLALVVGGQSSPWGPLVGALVISSVEVMVAYYWSGDYVNLALLVLALGFFTARPAGMFAVRIRT